MKAVHLVGGGLAGLTLGLALRRNGVPVTIWEAGRYPRHRVCGEFISGRGIGVLQRMGLTSVLQSRGLVEAQDTQFTIEGSASVRVRLPHRAWCLSRWELDAILAEAFQAAGGRLEAGSRQKVNHRVEGWIDCSGRKRRQTQQSNWVGVKFHLVDFPLGADLEMHLQDGAYVGLCRVEEGRVNVCGLLPRHRVQGEIGRDPVKAMGTLFSKSLEERLSSAVLVSDSLVTVAGLDYRAESVESNGGPPRVGDAAGLIPPITGNGMSLAFEAAQLCVEPVSCWAAGDGSWDAVGEAIRGRLTAQFQTRLFWARRLQSLLVRPETAGLRRALVPWLPQLLPAGFALTR